MKKILLIAAVLAFSSCDYREYPQEEVWKENLEKQSEEEKKESGP